MVRYIFTNVKTLTTGGIWKLLYKFFNIMYLYQTTYRSLIILVRYSHSFIQNIYRRFHGSIHFCSFAKHRTKTLTTGGLGEFFHYCDSVSLKFFSNNTIINIAIIIPTLSIKYKPLKSSTRHTRSPQVKDAPHPAPPVVSVFVPSLAKEQKCIEPCHFKL